MGTFLAGVVPSAGVLLLFWIAIKALVEGDRRERAAQARIEAAERRRHSATGRPAGEPKPGDEAGRPGA